MLEASLALAVVALACAVYALLRSAPARMLRQVTECTETVNTVEAAWRKERLALVEWLEEAQGVLESVERKRRQTSGHLARIGAGANQNAEPDWLNMPPDQAREALNRFARSRGML